MNNIYLCTFLYDYDMTISPIPICEHNHIMSNNKYNIIIDWC